MTETFNFSGGAKKFTLALMAIGLLGLILGFVFYHEHANRIWANILLNSYYFIGIALIGLFLTAVNQVGYAAWHSQLKRIFEATGAFIPVGGIGMIVILIAAWATDGHHFIYHWMDHSLYDANSSNYDAVMVGKHAFLNLPFFSLRVIAYIILWSFFAFILRRVSIKEDEIGGIKIYKKNKFYAAIFLIVFAITSSTASWDFIMSIDSHWYSTLFGWYNFSSYAVAGIATIILIVAFLKSQGYLKNVTADHYHNLGMFMFGFSVFWAYLWFSQFMLIWYANIPEETIYFSNRMNVPLFKGLFYFNILINFFFPFLVLMKRTAKRSLANLVFVAIVLIFGHWLDFYLMVMPGAVGGEHAGLGLLELSLLLGYIGLFAFVVLNTLTKASLVPVNNPYLNESLHHHTLK